MFAALFCGSFLSRHLVHNRGSHDLAMVRDHNPVPGDEHEGADAIVEDIDVLDSLLLGLAFVGIVVVVVFAATS